MRIRPTEASDFESVTALLELLGRAELTDATRERVRGVFESQLADADAAHVVAEDDGRVVGFCSLHYRERLNFATPEAWIPDLYVEEDARGQGVGFALLDEAERLARARGCHRLSLESGYQRDAAHHLYARFGMDDAGKFFTKALQ